MKNLSKYFRKIEKNEKKKKKFWKMDLKKYCFKKNRIFFEKCKKKFHVNNKVKDYDCTLSKMVLVFGFLQRSSVGYNIRWHRSDYSSTSATSRMARRPVASGHWKRPGVSKSSPCRISDRVGQTMTHRRREFFDSGFRGLFFSGSIGYDVFVLWMAFFLNFFFNIGSLLWILEEVCKLNGKKSKGRFF